MRIIGILTLALLSLGPLSLSAQPDTGYQTDTVRVNDRHTESVADANLAPSINVAVFAMIGDRSSYCPETVTFMTDAGALIKADVWSFNRGMSSLFLRVSGAIGMLDMYDIGVGAFIVPSLYLSASYANMECPECDYESIRWDYMSRRWDQLRSVRSSLMLAAGWGRRGFLIECNLFLYFEDEEYRIMYHDPMGGPGSSTHTFHPKTIGLRIGYSF